MAADVSAATMSSVVAITTATRSATNEQRRVATDAISSFGKQRCFHSAAVKSVFFLLLRVRPSLTSCWLQWPITIPLEGVFIWLDLASPCGEMTAAVAASKTTYKIVHIDFRQKLVEFFNFEQKRLEHKWVYRTIKSIIKITPFRTSSEVCSEWGRTQKIRLQYHAYT